MSHNPEKYFWQCVLDLKDGTSFQHTQLFPELHYGFHKAFTEDRILLLCHYFNNQTSQNNTSLCSFSTLQSSFLNAVCSALNVQHCREATKVQWFQYFPILQKHLSWLILFKIFALLSDCITHTVHNHLAADNHIAFFPFISHFQTTAFPCYPCNTSSFPVQHSCLLFQCFTSSVISLATFHSLF